MKIAVAAIGLLKPGPELDLAQDYEARIRALGRKAGISGLAISQWAESRHSDVKLRLEEERHLLCSAVPAGATTLVLDERGQALSSEEFAKLLRREADQGARQVTFLIGGPDGHSPETRAKATKSLSFGPATWPHRLVRVMLLEQIYRAVTIMVNHPYHRA